MLLSKHKVNLYFFISARLWSVFRYIDGKLCGMVCVCRSKDKDYSEKTHFFFLKLETPESHFGFPYVCFYACLLAVRASRHRHYGLIGVQRGLFRNATRPLLQGETALSAFLTKPRFCNILIISVPRLEQKSRFSRPCLEIAIRMSLNIC